MLETLLIIEDNASQLQMMTDALRQKMHYHTLSVSSRELALKKILTTHAAEISLILIDFEALGTAGVGIIRNIRSVHQEVPIILLGSYADNNLTSEALKAGADDFLTKPVTVERMCVSIRNTLKAERMRRYITWLERKIAGHIDLDDLVGESSTFKDALVVARQAASTKIPVWIEGEVGVGKETMARAIHGSSDRVGKPFVVVNCEMLPENRAEAILFGQDKGFIPNSPNFVLGKLREADRGTLCLKEVETLNPELQQRLLQFIESGMVMPLGSITPVKMDVRIICMADKSAGQPPAPGRLDTKLLHRLKRLVVSLPALQQRKEDILRLAEHFVLIFAASENKYIQGLTESAGRWLINSMWPGNVTQLSNTIWRAVMLSDADQIDVDLLKAVQQSKSIYFGQASQERVAANNNLLVDEKGQVKTLKSVEQEAIRFALQNANGCMMRAAKNLGIGRSTLYRKVGELEMDGYNSRANQTTRPMMNVSDADRS